MANYFHRQLGYYADAHRDRVNSVMHMIGNPILFVAVVLPLGLLPVSVLGVKISAAPLLTIPALVLWTAWDIAIGLAIVVTSIPLLLAASAIAGRVNILWVWVTAVGLFVLGWALQIVGRQLFEGKRPTNQYEGGVADANTFCTGPVCEQQVIPVVQYMVEKFGPRGYTLAADYNFGQLTAAWTKAFAPLVGGQIITEEFVPLSVSEFSQVIARVQQAKPDSVNPLLVGQDQQNYYPQAAAARLKFPMASTVNMAQGYEHKRFKPPSLANMHNAIQYQLEVPTARNRAFVKRWMTMLLDNPVS